MGEESQGKPTPADSVSFQWNDITRQFCDAASSLALGELFRDKDFTLLEAMSAIEMMDPKMDAGMLCNKSQNCSVEDAIAEGKFKVEHLSVNEIRAVLDSSFRCLVSWLEGHCLAQTVFTNLYLHKPALIEDRTMQTLALVSVKLVFVIKEIIYKIGAFEEEDFHGVTYNFYLGQDVPDSKACSLIRQCEDDLQKRAKRARQAKEGGPDGDDVEPEKEDPDDITQLYHRVRFLRLFFQNLSALYQDIRISSETRKTLQGVIDEVRVIRRENLDDDDNFPTTPGFDATANQRLLPSTFPRYTKVASCRSAYKYLEDMLLRIREVMEITGLHSYNQVLHFFSEFSKKSPCVLSRSIGRLVYMPSSGMVYGMTKTTDVLKDAIRTFCRPPVFVAKSAVSQSGECRDWAEGLLLRCCQPLFGLLQVTGHNRARQLEKCTRVLEDLAAVQDEAEKVDGLLLLAQKEVEPNCPIFQWFTMWLISYILKTQIAYLLMGFELDLYAEHEYCYIFWYLHEYLYRFLVTTLSQADSYMLECDKKLRKQKKDTRCTKPKKTTKGYHYKELLSTQVMQSVCGGFYKTMMALRMDGRLKFPNVEFDSEKIRFEHRFEAFQTVATPRVVTYEQYCEINDLSKSGFLTPSGMYDAASKCFKHAITLLESTGEPCPEQEALLKISKNNMVVVNLLRVGFKREPNITFERGHHMYFPLIKLSWNSPESTK